MFTKPLFFGKKNDKVTKPDNLYSKTRKNLKKQPFKTRMKIALVLFISFKRIFPLICVISFLLDLGKRLHERFFRIIFDSFIFSCNCNVSNLSTNFCEHLEMCYLLVVGFGQADLFIPRYHCSQ